MTTTKEKPRKYRNIRVTMDGRKFDSKTEAARYWELCQLVNAGDIKDLEVHPSFSLSVCTYYADFSYYDRSKGFARVVEDVKSTHTRTAAYRLKKKLMKKELGIDIVEVTGVSALAKQVVNRLAVGAGHEG
jgi:hypothetical protein